MEEGSTVQILFMLTPFVARREIIIFHRTKSFLSQGARWISFCLIFFCWCILRQYLKWVRKYLNITMIKPVRLNRPIIVSRCFSVHLPDFSVESMSQIQLSAFSVVRNSLKVRVLICQPSTTLASSNLSSAWCFIIFMMGVSRAGVVGVYWPGKCLQNYGNGVFDPLCVIVFIQASLE